MERRYQSTAVAASARRARATVRARRSAARAELADEDALRIGGALALLAVAASTGLLAAQAARLQRELRAR